MTYIARRLESVQEDGKSVEYRDAEFFALQAPLIILGEPGAGKSELVTEFATGSGSQIYRASALSLSTPAPVALPARIIVDGLDEVTAYTFGTPIVQLLEKLANHGHSNFVLTCRAVDWQHAANSAIIAGRWQHSPIVGRLLPLSDQEIIDFINANGNGQDGVTFLNEARRRDVTGLLRNPQNLLMLLKTVQTHGWPTTKTELGDASLGLWLRENDLILHLDALLKERAKYPDWATRWKNFVQWTRIHRDFTGAALEHARGQAALHPILQEQLTELERPPERDYEEEFRKQRRQYERQNAKRTRERHKQFHEIQNQLATGQRIDALHSVAGSYLGRFSDIRGETPIDRVAHLVGENLVPLALEGIAAAATRNDIPTARQMVELRVNEKKVDFFEAVLLTHCAILASNNRPLTELSLPVATSALAACQWDVNFIGDKITPDIQKQLEAIVFANGETKEAFLRDTLEPYLTNGDEHVSGLYRLARSQEFEDIAGKLSFEWLQRFTQPSTSSLRELLKAAIRYAPRDEVIKLVMVRIGRKAWANEDQRGIWMGAAFLLDYDNSVALLAAYADEGAARLWPIREMAFTNREQGGHWPQLVPAQNHFLITKFAPVWPTADHPSSGWCGDQNPWDASQFIQARINDLAADLSDEATGLLRKLVNHEGIKGYQNQIKHVLVQQARRRAEARRDTPSLPGVRNVLLQGEPANIDDLQAVVMDELELLQRRLKDGPTNGVQPFWNGDKPHDENYCRDRIVEHLTPYLEQKFKIRPYTEGAMPDSTRCDFLNTYGAMDLPVEVKGQWHRAVWTAALEQLQKYTREYRAQGRGIYLVLWFGRIAKKNPPKISGKQAPQTAQEMETLLREQLEGKLSDYTRIFVLDVSRTS